MGETRRGGPRRGIPIIAAALLLLAGAARAQDARPNEKLHFSVEHDLAGFEAAQYGDAADLYPFADYKELDGKELTREEFDAVVAKWKAERERVGKEIAALATDPALRSRRRLHRKLANHPFLSRLELAENASFAPVLIVVQRPPKAKPGFDEALAQTHGPWLKLAVDSFEKEFKEVLPARREGCALLPVIFLASYGDFVNYCKTASGGAFNGAAHFNADLQAVVCYAELMGGTRDEAVERRAALYGLVHSLIQSYAPSNDQTSNQWWLREGLARLFSSWSGDAKSPQVGVGDDKGLLWIGGVVTNAHRRDLFFLPVQELLAVKNADDVYNRLQARLDPADATDSDWGYSVRGAFTVECGLVVADLLRADGGRQRPLLTGRLSLLVAAPKGPAPTLPPGLDPGALQKQLAATLQSELKRIKSPVQIDDALKATLATWKPDRGADAAPKGDARGDVARAATGLTGASDDGPFDPARLLAEPLPVEARLGIALRLAGIGEFDAAAWTCDEIAKTLDAAEPLHERVARESQRLHELAQWRRDFVATWQAGGKKLHIDHDGSSTTGMVKAIEENDLVLLDAKGRELRVALAALDCEQILRRAVEAKLEPGTPQVRAYAALVAGHKNWAKGLTGTTPEESALKSEGARWPELLAQGELAGRLQKLAHATVPANTTQAAAPLAELRALLVAKDPAKIVEPRRDLLRKFAALCYRRQFDAVGIAAAGLKGRVLSKPDGTVRITYTFDNPAEFDDWVPANLQLWGKKDLDKIKTPAAQQIGRIEKGALRLLGIKSWLSKFELRAPLTATYKYQVCAPDEGAPKVDLATISITLCDDGKKSRIEATDRGGIESTDAKTGFLERAYEFQRYDWDTVYDIRLEHDGKELHFANEGAPERRIPAGPRQSGRVGIFVCSDAWIALEELEIEGHVDEQTLAPLRTAWVDQQVAALEHGDAKPAKNEKGDRPGR